MTDRDHDRGPARAVSAVVSGIAAGAYAFATGLFTLDPTFLLSGNWFGITSLLTRILGPEFVPGVPWDPIFVVAALGMLAVSFYKLSERRNTT